MLLWAIFVLFKNRPFSDIEVYLISTVAHTGLLYTVDPGAVVSCFTLTLDRAVRALTPSESEHCVSGNMVEDLSLGATENRCLHHTWCGTVRTGVLPSSGAPPPSRDESAPTSY